MFQIPYQLIILSIITQTCCGLLPEYSDEDSDVFTEPDSLAQITKKLDLSYSLESNIDSDFSIQQTTEDDLSTTEAPQIEELNLYVIVNENATELISCDIVEFVDLIQNSKYVIDKTSSIRDALEDTSTILLLTAPRRWGKTVTLTMFKTFLEIQTYGNNSETVPLTETPNYQLFKYGYLPNGDCLKTPATSISDDDELIDEYLGQYPVIYISFRGIGKRARNVKVFRSNIRTKIVQVFRAHEYLLNIYRQTINDNSSDIEIRRRVKKNIKIFLSFMHDEASDDEFLTSLNHLSTMLRDHFDRNIFLLIDDYDDPIVDIIQHDKFAFKEIALEYYYDLLKETLSQNKNIKKAIVAGIFKMDKKRIFSRPKSSKLKELSIFDTELYSYIGINENEILSLYRKIPSAVAHEIAHKYNAFKSGIDDSAKVYNPWSICMHLKDKRAFKPVYEEDEPAGAMDKMFPVFMKNKYFEDAITQLLLKSDYHVVLSSTDFTATEFMEIQNYTTVPHYNATSVNISLKYLLICGYLTFSDDCEESMENITLTVPNAEMIFRLENYSIPHFVEHLHFETSRELKTEVPVLNEKFVKFLENNDTNASKLEKLFTRFLNKMPPFQGASKKMPKNTIRPTFHNIGSIVNSFVILDRDNFPFQPVRFETINETCVFVFTDDTRGIIIEMKYGFLDPSNNKNYPLQEIKWNKLMDIFKEPQFVDQIQLVKLLSIRVNPTKIVEICVKIECEKPPHVKAKRRQKGEPRSFASDEYDNVFG